MSNKFDIIVVGGGMVGLAMAAALAESKLKILLIEKQDLDTSLSNGLLENQPIEDQEFDTRVSAISPGNRQFLSQLQAWQNIPKFRQANYEHMKVWDGDGSGKIEFSAAKIAQRDLGVIVENQVIQTALIKQIKSFGNIETRFGVGLKEIESLVDEVMVVIDNGESYKSQLLIGADGANSAVKEKLGMNTTQLDYEQIAFVANVKTEKPHQNTAWQRFTPYGPVAFLPLANENLCSVVWSIDKEQAESLKDIDKQAFAKKLQFAFESKLGEVTAVSEYSGFPLVKRHSQNYLSDRVALVGDAAHTIHPLAGQGVNLGFQDVACLSKLILKLNSQQRDIGKKENLRSFERERKTENLIMQNAMSGFKNLFANQSMPVTLLRNFAMSAVDKMPMAKEMIIKKAMGI
ncbi:MAG: UbiH/UbiF/VisC/COQ6 family ubiquinone biosynthesis hydroxylase [Kangiellaceae bacterium]